MLKVVTQSIGILEKDQIHLTEIQGNEHMHKWHTIRSDTHFWEKAVSDNRWSNAGLRAFLKSFCKDLSQQPSNDRHSVLTLSASHQYYDGS